jgi:hypothetical protein
VKGFEMSHNDLSTTEPQLPARGAYTIREFAEAHGFSESMFFKLQIAPATMVVGTRRLISIEAAARWRREREVAAMASA